jgi:CheY-like chemotaxis protein
MRFLVVDDEPEVRRLLRDNIVRWGHDVDLAENGAACLAACADAVPDVLLLDVAMPGLDGPAVLAALRENGTAPPHVVLVSAVPYERQRELAEQLGVRVLSKPFDVEALERFFDPILTA